MNKSIKRTLLFTNAVVVISFILTCFEACAKDIEYIISKRNDGGYTMEIKYSKRLMKPITAEGMFPLVQRTYKISIKGQGNRREYNRKSGLYYGSESIDTDKKNWDFGYAWVDLNTRKIYLNFYWAVAPDDVLPSDINGEYTIDRNGDGQQR